MDSAPKTYNAVHVLRHGVEALADLGGDGALTVLLEAARVAVGAETAELRRPSAVGVPGVAAREVTTLRIALGWPHHEPAELRLSGFSAREPDPALAELYGVLLTAHLRAADVRAVERLQARHRAAVTRVVEAAVRHRDVDDILTAAVGALRDGMLCQGVSIRAFDDPQSASMRRYAVTHPPEGERLVTDELLDISGRAARVCWERQTASLMHIDDTGIEPITTTSERDFMFDVMRLIGATEMLMAPMGAGGQCHGWIALTRTEVHQPFGPEDVDAVLAIGREIGNAVQHARAFERQQILISQLTDVSEHKSRFTATLAHQLKNPLASIQGHVEILRDTTSERIDFTRFSLSAIDRGARRIRDITDSLLSLARLEETARPLAMRSVDLHDLIAACIEGNEQEARNRAVSLDVSGVAAATVTCQRDEIDMVVDNLLSNAIKYSPSGSTVRLGLSTHEAGVNLSFEDDGIGMDREDLDRVFTPFHRADDVRRRQIPGTGLGMAIVKAAVERHHGRIDVRSQPLRGTRINVWLPRDPAQAVHTRSTSA